MRTWTDREFQRLLELIGARRRELEPGLTAATKLLEGYLVNMSFSNVRETGPSYSNDHRSTERDQHASSNMNFEEAVVSPSIVQELNFHEDPQIENEIFGAQVSSSSENGIACVGPVDLSDPRGSSNFSDVDFGSMFPDVFELDGFP